MKTEFIKVTFEGDILEAIPQGNDVWVSVRKICEALSIDPKAQQDKLKAKCWATWGNIPLVAQDTRIREVFCLHIDSLPMWLAGIDAKRVNLEIRPKLERYQLTCAKVLKEALVRPFLRPSSPYVDPIDFVVQQAQGLITLANEMKSQSLRLGQVEATIDKFITSKETAEKELLQVERANEKPAQRTTRSKLVELVRAYAYATGANYQMTWNKLYRELQYRYHFDAKSRAKHQKRTPLEIIEQEGQIETLFIIASEIFPIPRPQTQSSHRSAVSNE